MLAGFAPVFTPEARLLLLGSFPSVASLAAQRYYAHPRNQFWRLMGEVLALPLAGMAYEERLDALRRRRIALWDVISHAEREGSLDADIRSRVHSPLATLIRQLPALEAVAFNGGTSARAGRALLRTVDRPLALIDLPSSSPAYTLAFERKAAAWAALQDWLHKR